MVTHNSFAKTISKVGELINELERTYKSFELITIVPISSGYVLYYKINKKED